MGKKTTSSLFVFKVALKNAKGIWRRIAIGGDQTLDDLHEAIFDAFDREEEHLYSFYFPRPGARGRDRLDGAVEFTHPAAAKDAGFFSDDPVHNASEAKISTLKLTKSTTIEYLFDFGDNWEHILTVEEIDGDPDNKKYPRVLEKKGESPLQYPDLDDDDE